MATEAQIAANRLNAKRSTGPKTSRGRHTSSSNALKHGLSRPLPLDYAVSTLIEHLRRTLVEDGASEDRQIAARRVAQAQVQLSRVRMERARLLTSLELQRCGSGYLQRLMVLDRYERIARAKRRLAADGLLIFECSVWLWFDLDRPAGSRKLGLFR